MKPEDVEPFLKRFETLRIAVIGDVILDHYIWGDVSRVSPEAPVPLVDVDRESYRLGGASNVALNLCTLGCKASLFGRTGDDDGAKVLQRLLQDANIRWLGSGVNATAMTIVKTRVVARNQQLCRLDREGRRADYALTDEDWEHVLRETLEECDGILLSDYAKGVIDNSLMGQLKTLAADKRLPVYCDPKPRFGRDFSNLELLTPNRLEAVSMSGVDWDQKDPFPTDAVVEGIQEKYNPRYLVVTLGAEGMLFAENGKIGGIVPTFAREVYDVSGAGDTVVSALCAALLAGASLEEAVKIANTAAGVVVGKLGTATVSQQEILTHLRKHPDIEEV